MLCLRPSRELNPGLLALCLENQTILIGLQSLKAQGGAALTKRGMLEIRIHIVFIIIRCITVVPGSPVVAQNPIELGAVCYLLGALR